MIDVACGYMIDKISGDVAVASAFIVKTEVVKVCTFAIFSELACDAGEYLFQYKSLGKKSFPFGGLDQSLALVIVLSSFSCHKQAENGLSILPKPVVSWSWALNVPAKKGFSNVVTPLSNSSDSVSLYGYSSNIFSK